jgi:hypothetical protein
VQNCAQNGRKCTLFHPKTHFFAHFCRGEGRLFGRPKMGVFRVRAVARARGRKTLFVSRFSWYKKTYRAFLADNELMRNFRLRCSSNASTPNLFNCVQLKTFGACRKVGDLFSILIHYFISISILFICPAQRGLQNSQPYLVSLERETFSTLRSQAFTAVNENETRRRAACRRRSEVDVPLGGWNFVNFVVADIACLPAPENV